VSCYGGIASSLKVLKDKSVDYPAISSIKNGDILKEVKRGGGIFIELMAG